MSGKMFFGMALFGVLLLSAFAPLAFAQSADATASPSAQATVSASPGAVASPTASPAAGRPGARIATAVEKRGKAMAAKDAAMEKKEKAADRMEAAKGKLVERKEMMVAARKKFLEEKAAFEKARDKLADARKKFAKRVKELSEKEREEYRAAVKDHFTGHIKRIRALVAQVKEREDAPAELVAEVEAFLAKAEADWQAASTAEQKKDVIKKLNKEWPAFQKRIHAALNKKRVDALVSKYEKVLERMQKAIDEAKAQGKDVTRLEEVKAKYEASLAALRAGELSPKEAAHRLRHLAWGVRIFVHRHRAAVGGAVGAEEPEPTVEPTSATATPEATATATPAATASATASPEATATVTPSAAASASPAATASPTASVVATASASASPSATPTPTAAA